MADRTRLVAGKVRELKPKGRPIRKAIKAVLLIALVMAAGHLGACWYAQSRLDAALDAYRRAGEPIEPVDFLEPLPPAEQNGALDWMAAGDLIDRESPPWKALDRLDDVALPLDGAELAKVEAVERVSRDALRRVAAAAGKPLVVWPRGPDNPIGSESDPWAGVTWRLIPLLHASALRAHQLGDERLALARVAQLMALARAVDRDPCWAAHVNALYADSWACEAIFEIAPDLGAAGLEPARAMIAGLLDDPTPRAAFARAMKGERAIAGWLIRSFANGERDFRGRRSLNLETLPFVYGWRPLALYDAPIAMRQAGEIAAAATVAENWPAFLRRAPELPAPVEYREHPSLHVFAGIYGAWHERGFRTRFERLTERHLAATVLALRCYAADHGGRLPATLDELVPGYLPALPTDLMAAAGRTLGYRPDGPDPVVYSVGDNGTDDLGSEALPDGRAMPTDCVPPRWARLDGVVHLVRQPRFVRPTDPE
jgi:hypothetical protein